MDDLQQLISEHLQFYGYQTQVDEGILKASHATHAHFWVLPGPAGVVFRTVFRIAPAAQESPADFLKFLNDANNLSVVSRYVDRQGFLSIEAWFPKCYEREIFAAFFEQYLADMRAPVDKNREAVLRFFPE